VGEVSVKPSTSDEYLAGLLAAAEGGPLGDIVRSIEAEQDRIIRADPDTPVLVRGVAGSGKTSIAYHRLAYLLYPGNAPRVRASSSIVFAPNHLFIGYASPLMKRLGISSIVQTTFEDWAVALLGGQVPPGDEAMTQERAARARLLGDTRMLELVSSWLEEVSRRLLPELLSRPIPDGEIAFKYDRAPRRNLKLRIPLVGDKGQYLQDLEDAFKERPVFQAQDELVRRTWTNAFSRFAEQRKKKHGDLDAGNKKAHDASERVHAEARIRKALHLPSPQEFAVQMLSDADWLTSAAADIFDPAERELLCRRQAAPDGRLLLEELDVAVALAGVMGIKTPTYSHIVVDEVQDWSPLRLSIVSDLCPADSLTILGDPMQRISEAGSDDEWEAYARILGIGPESSAFLRINYRSARGVVEACNSILSTAGRPEGVAAFIDRGPDAFRISGSDDEDSQYRLMCDAVLEMIESYGQAAVVAKSHDRAVEIGAALTAIGFDGVHVVDSRGDFEEAGICVLGVADAKGLEFPGVIVPDCDRSTYTLEGNDWRLLFVAFSRALHALRALYVGDPLPLLARDPTNEST